MRILIRPVVSAAPDAARLGWLLWMVQVRIFLNQTIRSHDPWRIIGFLIAASFLLLFWALEALVGLSALDGLRGVSMRSLEPVVAPLLGWLYLGYALLLLFSAALFAISGLLLNRDLGLLLAAPRPVASVVGGRILTQVLTLFGGSLLLTLPFVLLVALSLGQPAGALTLTTLMALYPVLPVAAVSLLTLALVRVTPPGRAREVLGLLTLLFVVGINSSNVIFNPAFHRGGVQLADYLPVMPVASATWSPAGWAGRAMAAAVAGDWPAAAEWGGFLLVLSLSVFLIAVVLSGPLYLSGWAENIQGGRRQSPSHRTVRLPVAFPRLRSNGAVVAVLIKDLRVRWRDLAQLARLAMPVCFLLGIIALNAGRLLPWVRSLPPGPTRALVGVGPAILLLATLSNGLGLSAVGLEGQALWIYRASPNSIRRFLEAKCLAAGLPTIAVSTGGGLILEAVLRPGWPWALGAVLVVVILGLALTGVMVGVGGVWARFDWIDARRILRPLTIVVAALAQWAVVILILLFALGPVLLAAALHLPLLLFWVIGIVAAGGVGLSLALVTLLLAERRLARLEVL